VDVRAPIDDRFPALAAAGYDITSVRTDAYNCVAWIIRDVAEWWAPGYSWPLEINDEDALSSYVAFFEFHGFRQCADGLLVPGMEKIAIYGENDGFDHVAFQLPDGRWSSKLGELNDLRHESLDVLSGPSFIEYGPVVLFMERERHPHPLAERGFLLPRE
jgi:hypothetical protein